MPESSLFDMNAFQESPQGDSPSAPADPATATSGQTAQSQSLYRKYRPQSFRPDEFFGQQHIVHTLRNAIALDRIAHAYLFCGPRGTGKTSTARLMAKAVNCLDPDPYNRPCNVCDACIAITRNATTDVIEIDAASNRGIDDIRDLRERVKYAPTQLKTKFYIIDEAHQITGAAANAFLKTLEEPPAHTRFVLATTDPEELLQTIVSRCQRFDFRRIDLDSMRACLNRVASLESITIDDDAITAIARFATGSLRDALSLLDQVAVYRESDSRAAERTTVETVRTVLGVSRNDRIEALASALADHDAAEGLAAIGRAVDDGDDIRQLGRQLTAYLRLLMLERAGGAPDADDAAKALAGRFTLAQLGDLVRRFADIDYQIRHSVFPQLPLELAIVEGSLTRDEAGPENPAAPDHAAENPTATQGTRSTSPVLNDESSPPAESRTSLRDRVRGQASRSPSRITGESPPDRSAPESPPDARTDAGSTASAEPSAERPPVELAASGPGETVSGDVTLERLVDLWSKIRADVKAVNRRIEALLQQIDPFSVTGTRITLVSAYEFHRNRINSEDARKVIEDVISRLVGRPVQVTCVTREEANAITPQPAPTAPATDPEPPSQEDSANSAEQLSPPGQTEDAVVSSPDADEQRIEAAKNIFDAEEVEG